MTMLLIDVGELDEKTCEGCNYIDADHCPIFKCEIIKYKRCNGCIKAEKVVKKLFEQLQSKTSTGV